MREHRLDHMVAADAQMIRADLAGRVPVADMPGQPRQISAHLDQVFGCCLYPNRPPIVEREAPVIVEVRHLRQIDQKGEATPPHQPLAPHQPRVIVEHDRVGDAVGRVLQQAAGNG
jgi:hypothetical protein